MHRHRRLLGGLVIALLVLAAVAYRLTPLWPGPSMPSGATRLALATEPAHLAPTLSCATALLLPARIAVAGGALVLVAQPSGTAINVVWPSGWAAWIADGRAELVTRDGTLIGREGDLTTGLGGGVGVDGAFHICELGV